ncbi:uncharacterized protein LOC141906082 [Tubulanus polymorphus]|uniref:uncharacterized protein LOC141906082 n=1 Tax=Tubulanus polymorphus TaxID=672921 RepID=UPI003DA5DF7F
MMMQLLVTLFIIGLTGSTVYAACSPGMYINTCERLNLYDKFPAEECDSFNVKGNQYCCEHRVCRKGETEERCMRACVNNYLLCSLERKVRPTAAVAQRCTDFFNSRRYCNMGCFSKRCSDTLDAYEALEDKSRYPLDVTKFENECTCLYELECDISCWNGFDVTNLNIGWNKIYHHPQDLPDVQRSYLAAYHDTVNYYGNCDAEYSNDWQNKRAKILKIIDDVKNLK